MSAQILAFDRDPQMVQLCKSSQAQKRQEAKEGSFRSDVEYFQDDISLQWEDLSERLRRVEGQVDPFVIQFNFIETCKTAFSRKFDYEEVIFRWNLKVPFIKQSLQSPFESPVFVGGEERQHSWQLRWQRVLNGAVYEYRVLLVLVATGNSSQPGISIQGDKIQAFARLSLKKPDETELLQVQTGNEGVILEDVTAGQIWKTLAIKEAEFLDESKGYILNNIFTVCCKIFVSCGVRNSSVSKVYSVGPSIGTASSLSNETASLAHVTQTAFQSTDFADIQLVTGSKSIPAHKVILAARSRVFSAMFRSNLEEAKKNTVDIKDFPLDIVKALLEFIYTGKILNFTDETDRATAVEYLRISDKYELLEMKSQCERFLCLKVTVEDAVELLQVASLYGCSALKATVVQFIMRNKQKVCGTDSFKKLADPSILLELFMFT